MIETKKWELLQIYKHECNAFQDLLVLTFKNCSKCCGCFNPLSIKQILKRTIWNPPRNLKQN
jgi:hypothetical protein